MKFIKEQTIHMCQSFQNCIFCFKELSAPPKGVGEHVVPKNIFGFWRIYDICDECRNYFGTYVDHLGINNPYILEAIEKLELGDTDELYRHLPFIGEDTLDRKNVDMIYKKNTYKTKVRQDGSHFFECPEEDWEKLGLNWIISNMRRDPSTEEINEFQKMFNKYKSLKPGEKTHSELLGYTTIKRQVKSPKLNLEKLPSITPLICKIAYSVLMYIDPSLFKTEDSILRRHARFSENLPEYEVNWCSKDNFRNRYAKFHRIILHIDNPYPVLDINLFGSINWRILIRQPISYKIKTFGGENAIRCFLILDFQDVKNPSKWLGFQDAAGESNYRKIFI